jgi:hypothetical protein
MLERLNSSALGEIEELELLGASQSSSIVFTAMIHGN